MDKIYEARRNRLITVASRHASKLFGETAPSKPEREEWMRNWNQAFHSKMNELALGLGLMD